LINPAASLAFGHFTTAYSLYGGLKGRRVQHHSSGAAVMGGLVISWLLLDDEISGGEGCDRRL
jgi:hypothetical protein